MTNVKSEIFTVSDLTIRDSENGIQTGANSRKCHHSVCNNDVENPETSANVKWPCLQLDVRTGVQDVFKPSPSDNRSVPMKRAGTPSLKTFTVSADPVLSDPVSTLTSSFTANQFQFGPMFTNNSIQAFAELYDIDISESQHFIQFDPQQPMQSTEMNGYSEYGSITTVRDNQKYIESPWQCDPRSTYTKIRSEFSTLDHLPFDAPFNFNVSLEPVTRPSSCPPAKAILRSWLLAKMSNQRN